MGENMESKIRVTVQFEGEEARLFREVRRRLCFTRNQSVGAFLIGKALNAEADLFKIRR